jgi:hypothetical protein
LSLLKLNFNKHDPESKIYLGTTPKTRRRFYVNWLFESLTPGVPVVSTVGASSLKAWRGIVFVALIVGLMAMGRGAWAFSCSYVTQIPKTECEVLVALYESTDGDNWDNNGGWNETNTPCDWYGISCSGGHVTSITLGSRNSYGNNLSGSLPESLGNLSNLQVLNLGRNGKISGSIPESLGNLSNLVDLDLHQNNLLSGSIPESLGNLSNLQHLFLGTNQLSGSIPESLGNLSNLESLTLGSNQLSGSIPESLGNLSNLSYIDVRHNQLSGSIPESFWRNLSNLSNLSNFHHLFLNDNKFSGSIPDSFWNSIESISNLHLHNNEFCGDIPLSLMNNGIPSTFHLFGNHFTASDPDLIAWLNANSTWGTQTPCPQQAETCLVYGVHDGGLNDSQFFSIEKDFEVKPLGDTHFGHDIEGLDMHPETKALFASSGDDPDAGFENGALYTVNKDDGTLTPVCRTGLGEVSAMSFHPTNHHLWVWADGEGLFTIDIAQIEDGVCAKTEILLNSERVEALAWDSQGEKLYGAAGTVLYQSENGEVTEKCNDFPSEVEALEVVVLEGNERLLFALHAASDTSIHSFDVDTCSIIDSVPLPVDTLYTDIEGITWNALD